MGSVSLEEARKLIGSNEVDVIDLRDDEEWANGNIPGARRAGDDVEAEVESIDSDRRLLIVCQDGSRSADVAEKLSDGEREADSLEGGMSAWLEKGMPSQPTEDYEPPSEDDAEDQGDATEQDDSPGQDESPEQGESTEQGHGEPGQAAGGGEGSETA